MNLYSSLKIIFKDRFSFFLIILWVLLFVTLFLLWRYLIQNNQLPIYSPIKIFPVQYSVITSVINLFLALAVAEKSIKINHQLLALSSGIVLLNILMVIYSYSFFN